MKSSTTQRSALSRETLDVIENLANNNENYSYNYNNEEAYTPNEYQREDEPQNKSKEIDLLWQSFRPSRFNTNSPMMCALGGFLAGVILTAGVMSFMGAISKNHTNLPAVPAAIETTTETDEASEIPTVTDTAETEQIVAESSDVKMEKYVIKSGDTVEGIIKHFYGKYTPERAEAIMKANNLKNLDRISIDQVLMIPLEK